MRTTLDIDDDLLAAAKELACQQRKSAGQVISELMRAALSPAPPGEAAESPASYGFRPFPPRGTVVTNERIDPLREEFGD